MCNPNCPYRITCINGDVIGSNCSSGGINSTTIVRVPFKSDIAIGGGDVNCRINAIACIAGSIDRNITTGIH